MNPLFLIPVAVIIVGVALSFYMTKKHNAAKSLIDMDLERSKHELYKQEILASEFPQLKQWMKGKSIDAFTSASVPQTMASKVQGIVTDGLKNVALSAVGVKLRRIETECFWVLSGNDLYFFTTNEVGELDETIVFDNFRIEKAQLEFVGILKLHFGVYLKSSEEYLPKAHVITFGMEDGPMSLAIHDRLNYVVDPTDLFNQKKQMETRMKFQVVGERFVTTLQDKFPNLKIA